MSKRLNDGAGYFYEKYELDGRQRERKVYRLYDEATKWLMENSYLEAGGVCYTESGDLKYDSKRQCKYVIHTVSVGTYRHPHETSKFYLKRQITNILMTAKELQVKSIVLPLLGVGDSNFPVEVAVEVISKTIMEFHSVDSQENKKASAMGLWGKSTQLESVIVVIWKNREAGDDPEHNPSLLYYETAKTKFD